MSTGSPKDDSGILVTLRESTAPVRALLLGVFVNKLGAFIQVYLVLFLTHRGFTVLQAGVALGVYGAGSVFGELAGGAMSDRLGQRRTILLGMTGTAACILAVLVFRPYPLVLLAVLVVGLVSHVYRSAAASLLAELTPAHRQVMIFAVYRLAINLGTTAGPLIGALLLSVSYNLLFWAEAGAAAVFVAIAAVALPRREPVWIPLAGSEGGAAGGVPVETSAAGGERAGYLALLGDRRFLLYLAAMLVNATIYVQYLGTLPLAMHAAGLAVGWYGAMVALNGLLVITCELLVTNVVQHWPSRLVVATGFTLIGAGFAAYALPWGLAAFVVGTLGWTLAEIVGGPTMFAYPAQVGPARLRGRYIGAASAMFGVGTAIGPILGVAAFAAIGSQVWLWCGLFAMLGLAAAWYGMHLPASGAEPGGIEPGGIGPASVEPASPGTSNSDPAVVMR